MPKSYVDTLKQIEDLNKHADTLRRKEAPGVIERMKQAIKVYGITAEDLGLTASVSGRSAPSAKSVKVSKTSTTKKSSGALDPKYRDADGNTWGGMGKRPDWLRAALASGRTIDEFAVSSGHQATPPAAVSGESAAEAPAAAKKVASKSKSKAKRPVKKAATAKVQFRDPTSQKVWSGMGPRPKWLKDAEAQGQQIEQISA